MTTVEKARAVYAVMEKRATAQRKDYVRGLLTDYMQKKASQAPAVKTAGWINLLGENRWEDTKGKPGVTDYRPYSGKSRNDVIASRPEGNVLAGVRPPTTGWVNPDKTRNAATAERMNALKPNWLTKILAHWPANPYPDDSILAKLQSDKWLGRWMH